MKCPSCDVELGNRKICKECGYDLRVYDKAKKVSNTLYNKGLALIINGCISQGINLLEKSLEFNKKNTTARNLLGLSYMCLGRVGDSLKQWIISAHISKEGNIANEYIEIAQKNKAKLAKYDEAIGMYNEALAYMKEKNEDMSIIRLKKAIYLSDNFLDAYKLLILCYIVQGNYEKAMETIDKATKIDYNNEDLIHYYKILNPDSTIEKQSNAGDKHKIQKIYMKPRQVPGINRRRLVMSLSLLSGVIVVSGFITFIAFSFLFTSEAKKLRDENSILKASNEDLKAQVKQYSEDNSDKDEVINTLKQENSSVNQTKVLAQAQEFFNNKNLEQAAIKLMVVDKSKLTQDEINTFNNIYDATMPKLAKDYYDKGKKYYSEGKLDDALYNYEKSIQYSTKEGFSSESYYNAALIREKRNDTEKALEYLNIIISKYKDSDVYEKAVDKKKDLEK